MKYECELCEHVYDPEQKKEEEIQLLKTFPDRWPCPSCGLSGFVFSIKP